MLYALGFSYASKDGIWVVKSGTGDHVRESDKMAEKKRYVLKAETGRYKISGKEIRTEVSKSVERYFAPVTGMYRAVKKTIAKKGK